MTITRQYEGMYHEWDQQGRMVTRTRQGSDEVASNERLTLFQIEDQTGRITIDPTDGQLTTEKVQSRVEPGSWRDVAYSIATGAGSRTLGYEYEEWAIPVGHRLYVLGEATDTSGELRTPSPRAWGCPLRCGRWRGCSRPSRSAMGLGSPRRPSGSDSKPRAWSGNAGRVGCRWRWMRPLWKKGGHHPSLHAGGPGAAGRLSRRAGPRERQDLPGRGLDGWPRPSDLRPRLWPPGECVGVGRLRAHDRVGHHAL
jgi:E3 Ubiquitin ligase